MKKLLLATVLLVSTGLAYAGCPDNAQKITDRIKSHPQVTAIDITYSPDKETWAKDMQGQITKLYSTLTVNLVPTTGNDVCKIGRA